MASKQLDIDELLLDLENPRISRAGSQREAIQKIIEDQDVKLVVLAAVRHNASSTGCIGSPPVRTSGGM